MRIRLATDADAELTTRLRLAFLADHRGIDPSVFPPAFVAATETFMTERARAGDLLTWLAELDEPGTGVVGVVSVLLHQVPPRPTIDRSADDGHGVPGAADELGTIEGYVINLFVPPHARRRGIGRRLLGSCIDHARADGYRRLVLHATDDGLPLYEQAGFTATARWMELPL